MPEITIYTSEICPYCIRAKKLLDTKHVHYTEIRVDLDTAQREIMMNRSQRKTVPQIFINDFHVGGCDDLYALEQKGKLDELLNT
ncbi:MAG: Glutaredoxin 3 [Legionellaceae bacterium]